LSWQKQLKIGIDNGFFSTIIFLNLQIVYYTTFSFALWFLKIPFNREYSLQSLMWPEAIVPEHIVGKLLTEIVQGKGYGNFSGAFRLKRPEKAFQYGNTPVFAYVLRAKLLSY